MFIPKAYGQDQSSEFIQSEIQRLESEKLKLSQKIQELKQELTQIKKEELEKNTGAKSSQWKESQYQEFNFESFSEYAPAKEPIDFENVDYLLLQASIFYESNRKRVSASQGKLSVFGFCKPCSEAAQLHAADMVRQNFFSHYNSRDKTKYDPSKRLALFGYIPNRAAENIALTFGIRYKSGTRVQTFEGIPHHSYRSFAEDLLDAWMKSPSHRANIMRNTLTHLGTGAWILMDKVIQFKSVQVFSDSAY